MGVILRHRWPGDHSGCRKPRGDVGTCGEALSLALAIRECQQPRQRYVMPTYVYECAKCGDEFELWQSFSDEPLKKHSGCGGKVTKVLQPVGIVLKGSGFYKTDNRGSSKSSSSSKKSEGASESSSESSSSSSDSSSSSTSSTELSPSRSSSDLVRICSS